MRRARCDAEQWQLSDLIKKRPKSTAVPDDVRMYLVNVMCLEATLNCYTFKQRIQFYDITVKHRFVDSKSGW
jgi:hypothetical protein